MDAGPEIVPLSAAEAERELAGLAAVLHACVHAGASVSFVLPFSLADAESFWRRKVLPGLHAGTVVLLAARDQGRIVGTVQIDCDTPPNQPHRAEVRKLLVHPEARRRGLARALMAELERRAAARGRTLITLDTASDDKAEPLYRSLGYNVVGVIPDYSLDPAGTPRRDPTTIMYKHLQPAAQTGA